ncbi:MAG TPA: arginase family protein [Acidimicrobiales bacterium]|nr:arginase family protein [Acidimicrobiales bacterium]
MATSHDPLWPAASTLLNAPARERSVALIGVSTYATSLTPRSALSSPAAIRDALERYSTWSVAQRSDLGEFVSVRDLGDVASPDEHDGHQRLAEMLASVDDDLLIVLGGDNAATWLALVALARDAISNFGLVTLDAHLDLRDGRSNGSPVRQLLDAGLDPACVVQVGLGEFSNSPAYARRALSQGLTSIPRRAFYDETPESLARQALTLAGAHGRRVYVDLDLDVVDRAAAPACPAAAPGGLSADELRRFAREIARDPRVVAVDLTEIDVERDVNETTVRLAALVVLELLAGVAERAS